MITKKKQVIELRVTAHHHGRTRESLRRAQLELDEEARDALLALPEEQRPFFPELLIRIGMVIEARTLFDSLITAVTSEYPRTDRMKWTDEATAFFDHYELRARKRLEDSGIASLFPVAMHKFAKLTSRLGLIALGDGSSHSPAWAPETESALTQLRQLGFQVPSKDENRRKPSETIWKFLRPLYNDALTHDACLRVYADRVCSWIERTRHKGKDREEVNAREVRPEDTGAAVLCDPKVLDSLELPDAELGKLVREIILERGMKALSELKDDLEE